MPVTPEDINVFIATIKDVSAYDFSDYSIKSFTRRVEKILIDNRIDIQTLISKVRTKPAFLEQIVRDITVNTTELFRDPKAWQTLRYRIFPRFDEQPRINIWHAGCSTGQELYSMLIMLNEMNLFDKTRITGSDINSDVLDTARKGEYVYRFNIDYLDNYNKVIRQNPYNFDEYYDIPYSKYFEIDRVKDTLKMNRFLVEKAVFEQHDLVGGKNVSDKKFDVIMCRNVLIYFNYELQNRIFDLFYESLAPKGILILGIHESILGPKANKFNKKGIIYIKK